MDFLIPTLIYITIGLWLTTALVEQLVDVFRLIHYYGRKVRNVKGVRLFLKFIQLKHNPFISFYFHPYFHRTAIYFIICQPFLLFDLDNKSMNKMIGKYR